MTDYVQIADAVVTTLLADSFVGNTANIKTVEAYERNYNLQGEEIRPFFTEAELPAVTIEPNTQPQEIDINTTRELRGGVHCQALVRSFNADRPAGKRAHHLLVKEVERVLQAQKTSSANLGISAFVRDVSTLDEEYKKEKDYFFTSTISFTVVRTTNF